MRVTSLLAIVVHRRSKIVKNLCVFERGENLLLNVVLHFVIRVSQSSERGKLEFKQTKNRFF